MPWYLYYLNPTFGQTCKDTTFFTHLTFNDQDRLPEGPKNHLLFWYTTKYIPNIYFVVEHFCGDRWVKRLKVNENSPLGKHEYFGKTGSKCEYRFKIQPHSGQNIMRVRLMNDSNVCLAISRELKWTSTLTPKVTYSEKKNTDEINFSSVTYYEIYDSAGNIVKDGRGTKVSYADLDKGIYILNYDNYSTTLRKK